MPHPKSYRPPDCIEPEKIGVTGLCQLKRKSRTYYVTVSDQMVNTFRLLTGDVLKVDFKEVFRQDLHAGEEETKPKKRGKSEEEWAEKY